MDGLRHDCNGSAHEPIGTRLPRARPYGSERRQQLYFVLFPTATRAYVLRVCGEADGDLQRNELLAALTQEERGRVLAHL